MSENAGQAVMERMLHTAASISKHSKSCAMLQRLADESEFAEVRNAERVRLAELHPQLRELLTSLPIDKVSDPIGTGRGPILFAVCDRQEIAPEAPDPKAIHHKLVEKKLSQIAQRELRNIKRAAFIDIRV